MSLTIHSRDMFLIRVAVAAAPHPKSVCCPTSKHTTPNSKVGPTRYLGPPLRVPMEASTTFDEGRRYFIPYRT